MRRRVSLSLAGALLSLAAPRQETLSPTEAISLLLSLCPMPWLRACETSGGWFYRGEGVSAPTLCSPVPDLLIAGTYADTDALDFFTRLEPLLAEAHSASRPSTGHLAVADAAAASAWGEVSSVWPLGRVSYAWPANRDAFWPLNADAAALRPDAYVIDTRLEEALHLRREVLFSATGGPATYLAIPSRFDSQIQAELRAARRKDLRFRISV